MQCHLCRSPSLRVLFTVFHERRVHTVAICGGCGVIQTVEQHALVSPEYVDLTSDAIDEGRLWCQGDHKAPAFRQWWSHARHLLSERCRTLRLLDVGCGTGGFLDFASSHGLDVYGFDASRVQAERAQKSFPNVRSASSLAEYLQALARPGVTFDIITLWDVIEHIRTPLDLLPELKRVLAPAGLLFMSTPNGRAMLWKRRLLAAAGMNHDHSWIPWEHVFYYSQASLSRYLNETGYQVVRSGAVVCYPRSLSLFEFVRRIGFRVLAAAPSYAPQLYLWARASASGLSRARD